MKIINFVILLIFISYISCNKSVPGSSNKNHNTDTLSSIDKTENNKLYRMEYNVPFQMGGMEMTYSVLYMNELIVDTIDTAVGFEYVGKDSIVFLPVKIWFDQDDGIVGTIENYVLLYNGKRIIIKDVLPYFDDYFSSPVVKNGKIYYWGIKYINRDNGYQDLYAMKYDFGISKLDSVYLKNYLQEGTDDMGFYSITLDNAELHFQLFNDKEWIFDIKGFTLKNNKQSSSN